MASPLENQVPGLSALTTAYPRAVQCTGSGDSKAAYRDTCPDATPISFAHAARLKTGR